MAAATLFRRPSLGRKNQHHNHNHNHCSVSTVGFCVLIFSVSLVQLYVSTLSSHMQHQQGMMPNDSDFPLLLEEQPHLTASEQQTIISGDSPRDAQIYISETITSKDGIIEEQQRIVGDQQHHQQQQQPSWKPRVVHLLDPPQLYAIDRAAQRRADDTGGDEGLVLSRSSGVVTPPQRVVDALSEATHPPCCSNDNDGTAESTTLQVIPLERRFYDECVPMVAWQSHSFPVCNVLHEIDVAAASYYDDHEDDLSLLSTQGSWRSVWKLQQQLGIGAAGGKNNETVVLKLLKLHREFNQESYDHHRVDALAMERLTASRHIVDIFGYCGQSVVSEFATGSARAFVKNESLSSLERLEIGRDIAQAVADLHSIDYANATNVTLTHNDMNMANAVEVHGRIKLNDFNIGVPQRWNVSGNSVCLTPVRFAAPLWKSPEENIGNNESALVDAAATDVYGLGNLLFHVLTRRQPWTHLEPGGPLTSAEAAERKVAGGQPFVPAKYSAQTTTKVALAALHLAVMSCFRTNPADRPTSHEIAQQLDTALHWIQERGSKIRPSELQRLFQ